MSHSHMTTPAKRLFADGDFEMIDAEPLLDEFEDGDCAECAGTGEGQYEGMSCSGCRGKGFFA